jgi:hypothetical protein
MIRVACVFGPMDVLCMQCAVHTCCSLESIPYFTPLGLQGLSPPVLVSSALLEPIRLDQVGCSDGLAEKRVCMIRVACVFGSMDVLCMQCAVHCMWPCMLDHPCLILACWCCRGHRLWNMPPLSGWRLSDWIRSDAVMMSRVRVPVLVELRVDVASTRAAHWNQFHISTAGAAGAVASSTCILCIAGTYQTGSGWMQRWMSRVPVHF